jgi:SAM-dependent methyltransferase
VYGGSFAYTAYTSVCNTAYFQNETIRARYIEMNNIKQGQVISSAAKVYERFFLPALFQEWTARVVDAARIAPGQHVLDVATGTGVLAREAAARLGQDGSVIGLDINQEMLAVARQKAPEINWRHGRAEELPFDDHTFDAVISQFGLMFFEDRQAAISEMVRVLRPGARLAVAVWDSLENTPGYLAVTELLQRLFGSEAADALRAPYVLGDKAQLYSLFEGVGLDEVNVATRRGTARFPSIGAWMYTDVRGWTLADMINDAQFELLQREAEKVLRPFVNGKGEVTFPAPAHIITGRAGVQEGST